METAFSYKYTVLILALYSAETWVLLGV